MTSERGDIRRSASRWYGSWTLLRRIGAAAAVTGDDLRDDRLERHDRRLAALEEEIGTLRRAEAGTQPARAASPAGSGTP